MSAQESECQGEESGSDIAGSPARGRRRLLLIAFHYPPIQGSSGVHRSLAFSKYLRDFGWDVSVLTVAPRAHENVLADNMRMVPDHVHVTRAPAWDAARHFSILGRYPSMLALPDRWSSWVPFGTSRGLRAIKAQRIDAIFSTFPIASAHLIGLNLRRRTGLPWVADFRDPMATPTYPHEASLRERWTRIQDSVVRGADRITVTTPGAASFYRRMYPGLPPERAVVIENGFDPEAFAGFTPASRSGRDGRLLLLHSGILYPRERDPKPFFTALRRLMDRGVIGPQSVHVCLRASGFDEHYASMVRELGLHDIVSFAPPLPYTQALEEMGNASALLLFQASVCNEQIPAKAYEYLYARRPIIGLTDTRGDTGRLLERFGVSGIARAEDADAIGAMLEAALPEIRNGTYRVPVLEDVMSVSRRAGAGQLAALLDEVVGERAYRPS